MFDYLTKFNALPKELREKVSSPAAVAAVDNLEKKYGVSLAATVMKVMVKDIAVGDLAMRLGEEFKLDKARAEQLAAEAKEKIFAPAAEYLRLTHSELSPLHKGDEGGLKTQQNPPNPLYAKGAEIQKFSTPSISTSSFFFSPEDEEEIKQLVKQTGGIIKSGVDSAKAMEEKLNRVMSGVRINFGSQMLSERFRTILLTYLRGIRDKIETKQALVKSFETGGLGFDADSADKVLALVDGQTEKTPKAPMVLPPKIKVAEDEKIKPPTRDVGYDFKKLVKKTDTSRELPAPKPPTAVPKISAPPVRPPVAPKERITAERSVFRQEQPSPFPVPAMVRRSSEAGGKIKMEDIKIVPRIMSPIDELKYMDLINFRRLDRDPAKATSRIKEKISLLEEENYNKKLEGIKAWRSSPVNKLYLQIGGLSIGENRPIDVIIEERKKAGKECLTVEEFKAVMDLNKSLRF